ncbi:MAG: NUDIX hydrolase [Deferrisomatales bacterium]|nr:NUDIX hydrolase [Deferrisomatales bacterium]
MSPSRLTPWPVLATTVEGDYPVFRLLRERARSPRTGACLDFFVLETRDWVTVLPLTEDEQVVLVRQYRHGVKQLTLEIPGGLIDPGETPAAAALRELQEETGYTAREVIPLGRVQPQPAIQNNICHTFLARGVTRVAAPTPDDGEDMEVVTVPLTELEDRVRSGEIAHGLVLAALYRFELWRRDHPGTP